MRRICSAILGEAVCLHAGAGRLHGYEGQGDMESRPSLSMHGCPHGDAIAGIPAVRGSDCRQTRRCRTVLATCRSFRPLRTMPLASSGRVWPLFQAVSCHERQDLEYHFTEIRYVHADMAKSAFTVPAQKVVLRSREVLKISKGRMRVGVSVGSCVGGRVCCLRKARGLDDGL